MALINKKSEAQKEAEAEARARRRAAEEEKRNAAEIEKARQAFFRTPAGQARVAFDRGDHVFQYAIDVVSQQAIIVAMVGSRTSQTTRDPVAILNSVCHEGWELVNGSFVFVEQGQQSRDKFLSSGQNVAVKGTVVGYYLFRRQESNRRAQGNPWEDPAKHVEGSGEGAAHRECPACRESMRRESSVCPRCHTASEPWRLIEGEWWQRRDDGFVVLDEASGEWLPATQDSPDPVS